MRTHQSRPLLALYRLYTGIADGVPSVQRRRGLLRALYRLYAGIADRTSRARVYTRQRSFWPGLDASAPTERGAVLYLALPKRRRLRGTCVLALPLRVLRPRSFVGLRSEQITARVGSITGVPGVHTT